MDHSHFRGREDELSWPPLCVLLSDAHQIVMDESSLTIIHATLLRKPTRSAKDMRALLVIMT